jgi:hypothetical protein
MGHQEDSIFKPLYKQFQIGALIKQVNVQPYSLDLGKHLISRRNPA